MHSNERTFVHVSYSACHIPSWQCTAPVEYLQLKLISFHVAWDGGTAAWGFASRGGVASRVKTRGRHQQQEVLQSSNNGLK